MYVICGCDFVEILCGEMEFVDVGGGFDDCGDLICVFFCFELCDLFFCGF